MPKDNRTLKTTLIVTLVVFMSKMSGFVRDMIMAAYYGTGLAMDAYSAAYAIYYLPILLLTSCITSTMVPLYTQVMAEDGLKRANRFAGNVLNLFAIFSLIISAVMFLFSEPLVRLIYGGYGVEKTALTVYLSRVMISSLMFSVSSVVLATLLNACGRFIEAQLTGFPLTVTLIAATVIFSQHYGITALAWGVCAAAVMQVLILLPALRGTFKYSARLRIKDRRFTKLVVLAIPAMLSMAVNELNHMADQVLAAPLPDGNITAMRYAFKIVSVLTGILLVPLTTIVFSHMSRSAAKRDIKGVVRQTVKYIEMISMIVLPVTVISAALSRDIIRAVFMRGAFNEASLALTAPAFTGYIVGLLGYGLRDLINRAFNALQDTRTPLIISAGTVALNVILDLLVVNSMGIAGLALATSVSSSLGALTLYMALRKKLGRIGGRRSLTEFLKIVFSSVACAIVCAALNSVLPEASGTLRIFARLSVCALGSLAMYIAVALLMGVRQLRPVAGFIGRRYGGSRK
jgi:putative peptidoglycan lipid II flippase